MELTKKLESEIKTFMDDYWDSYMKGDLTRWGKYLVNDYRNIGGTQEEIWNSKKEILDYTFAIMDQMAGQAEMRNKTTQIIPYDPYIMVHEFMDFYIKVEGKWAFYGKFRLSSLIQKVDSGWKVLHQHGSYPDSKTGEGEAFAFDEIKAENRKLKDAVKRRTIELEGRNRKLEIETSMERVRARTMAMQHSEELADTASVLFQQVKGLGFETWSCGFCTWQQNDIAEVWMGADSGGLLPPMMIPYKKEPTHHDIYKASQTGADSHEKIWEGKALQKHYDFLRTLPSVAAAIKQLEDAGLTLPTKQCYYVGFFKQGYLLLITKETNVEMRDISKRFAKVFEQTYTRFLDLQKAEAQAREAEIELALERVRARTMAMHDSTELAEVAVLLFQQIKHLGVVSFSSGFNIWDKEHKNLISWMSNATGEMNPPFELPIKDYEQHRRIFAAWEKKELFLVDDIKGKALTRHYKFLRSFPLLDASFTQVEEAGIKIPDRQVHNIVFFSNGYLLFITQERTPQYHSIFQRFGKVFDQTYTRFLDLQNAEAQASEAKIEASLERVRSRSMAMHKSDELKEAGELLWNELSKLGIQSLSSGYVLMDKEEKIGWTYAPNPATGKISEPIGCLHTETKEMLAVLSGWRKQEPLCVVEMDEQDTIAHQTFIAEQALNLDGTICQWITAEQLIALSPKRLFLHNFNFKQGYLLIVGGSRLTGEQIELMHRFTKVFQQTYTRFLDLQKAEAQAREAQIQLALERVRARTMAMQHSGELSPTASEMFKQIQSLGMKPWGCGFNIFDKDGKAVTQWMSLADGGISPAFRTPLTEDPFFINIYDARQRKEDLLVFESGGKSLEETYRYMFGLPGSGEIFGDLENSGFEMPKFQITHCAYFSQGYLVFITYEPVPEAHDIFKRFAKVFEQTYTRFLDLQKAEAQARESQIQLALERVRARTMAMQHSDELAETASLLFKQISDLGIETWTSGFNIWEKDDTSFMSYSPSPEGGITTPYSIPSTVDSFFEKIYKAKKRGEEFLVFESSGTSLANTYKYMKTLPVVKDVLKGIEDAGFQLPAFQINHCTFFAQGFLLFITPEPYPEAHDIFNRFSKVFEQTYTRFLDLQKAEASAREAQIEAALEKVRSRSLAMHTANELGDVVVVIVEKLKDLGVVLDANGVVLCTYFPDSKDVLHWMASPDFSIAGSYLLPYFDHPIFNDAWNSKIAGDEYFSKAFTVEEKNSFFAYAFEHSDYRNFPDDFKQWIFQNDKHSLSFAWQKNSAILIPSHTGILPTEDDIVILKRFAKVFEQSYVRFMDLQKAEAQAKEAQIEAALEKVRSRSMAMHKSDEMLEVIEVVSEQLLQLNLKFDTVSFGKNNQEGDFKFWFTSSGQPKPVLLQIPKLDCPILNTVQEAQKKGINFIANVFSPEENREWSQHLIAFSELKDFPKKVKDFILNSPGFARSGFLLKNIDMYVGNYRAVPFTKEENAIFQRFAQVFEQSYTRFLDLEKAEAQAREALIETGLEKVRSRTLAMQKSDELADTSIVIFEQLINLGIEPNRLFIGIIKAENGTIEAWATNEDGTKIGNHFILNTDRNESVKKMYEGWKHKKSSITIDMAGTELQNYFHYLADEIKIPFKGGLSQKRRIQTIAYFGQGLIGMASPDEQPEATTLLLERFAAVFNLTYTRFNDLKVAEAHAIQAEEDLIKLQTEKRRAEDALTNLKAAQKQLVQSEKMASLGELTAGIAHEIQNPLNFVNNFSEVSNELIDEMNEELEKGDIEEAKAIAADVKQNLIKINHHGNRAGDIVKGMLQHSRSSVGVKELTDINALADEYLRLSFHGLRAKDKSFNAELKTDFDESIGKINIIPQDIGRVLLNLYNNAFYACTERSRSTVNKQKGKNPISDTIEVTPFEKVSPLYEPTVSVTTKKSGNSVLITVSDNGNGIPQNIVDKIFQPFFTTKPTGQGTGLGLSLSYDIVKAHGGEIKVESEEGKGTEFMVQLPLAD